MIIWYSVISISKYDLQYEDAIPMFKRLQALADELNLAFGVKITNTFPVDVTRNELPSEEMYMSGKSLFPLSISLAARLSREFDGNSVSLIQAVLITIISTVSSDVVYGL